jgi:hypothetical protein
MKLYVSINRRHSR